MSVVPAHQGRQSCQFFHLFLDEAAANTGGSGAFAVGRKQRLCHLIRRRSSLCIRASKERCVNYNAVPGSSKPSGLTTILFPVVLIEDHVFAGRSGR